MSWGPRDAEEGKAPTLLWSLWDARESLGTFE